MIDIPVVSGFATEANITFAWEWLSTMGPTLSLDNGRESRIPGQTPAVAAAFQMAAPSPSFFFDNIGTCRFGEKCRILHGPASSKGKEKGRARVNLPVRIVMKRVRGDLSSGLLISVEV